MRWPRRRRTVVLAVFALILVAAGAAGLVYLLFQPVYPRNPEIEAERREWASFCTAFSDGTSELLLNLKPGDAPIFFEARERVRSYLASHETPTRLRAELDVYTQALDGHRPVDDPAVIAASGRLDTEIFDGVCRYLRTKSLD